MRRGLLFLLTVCALSLLGQEPAVAPASSPAPGRAGRGRGPGGPPKNLKIIKAEEIRAVMGMFVTGTGLTCMGCHVQGDFASDDKNEKIVARKMLEMVNDVNAKTFGGTAPGAAGKVTCFTCHRGEAHPKSAPDPK